MIPRLFLPPVGGRLQLSAPQSHYVTRVLRLSTGAVLEIFDGAGNSFYATLDAIHKDVATVAITKKLPPKEADKNLSVVVGQVVCAATKLEWAIEKMTELGAAKIDLIRAVNRPLNPARLNRWRRLAAAASAQCGRATVPAIADAGELKEWLSAVACAQKIMLSPRAKKYLYEVYQPSSQTALLIGAESGLSKKEEQAATANGFVAANLGARVLRTETAALAALSVIAATPL